MVYSRAKAKQLLLASLQTAVKRHDGFAVLFSGGVDSAVLAAVAKQLNKSFTCYAVGFSSSKDLDAAVSAASSLGVKLKIKLLSSSDLEQIIQKVKRIIDPADVVSFEIACVVFAALEMVRENKIKTVLIGSGAEETLTGYKRHTSVPASKLKCYMAQSLKESYKRDVKREQLLAKHFGVKIIAPYLAPDFVKAAMALPLSFKLNKTTNKVILRELALDIGIPGHIAFRKKVAAQYGSGFDREILRLAKKHGFRYRQSYLVQFKQNV